ncbi:MAG: alpha-N-arabinofuranosidase [Bacteroides sp.]|nr:hypothetical protein [Roseburia sp.]MCM1347707.1 alpha-N-arabinofuranosidase [Bacteroides sp.]MCM1421552.1 alpha-N-arabinofuranosidase [Bacteroides sp.]
MNQLFKSLMRSQIKSAVALSLLLTATTATGAVSKKPMKAPAGGKEISDHLIGIFFEDISSSADGGLYPDLVRNGSFEFNLMERDGWGPGTAWRMIRPGHSLGNLTVKQQSPIHPNNPNYMRIDVERTRRFRDYDGWSGFGLQNDGYGGMSVKKGETYDFSVFLRNVSVNTMTIRVALVNPHGEGNHLVCLASDTIVANADVWKKYSCTLTPDNDCRNAALQILMLDNGSVDIDMISLMPADTYKGHGLRKDLAEALENLSPKFMRFPGGCVVHGGGDGFWNTYRWKETVGPKETRKQQKNTWGYHQSMGLGYHEYFQLCEDMDMEPLPILPCGVSCQGANGGWGLWPEQAQDVVPMSEMDEWVQDALDLIEWANGDASTKWGKVRAEAGHPAPFNLKYLGIGNEEKISPEFNERFKYIYDIIKERHPEIVVVGTAGPGSHPGNPDFEAGWKLAQETEMPIIDEHYYEPREYFMKSRQYDSYPRDRKTKVYLGEYAAKDRKLIDALAEALYLIHVERNGDVVDMTSYAPLFAKKNATNWNPDLIYFDNDSVFPSCSYYVQQMFGKSAGTHFYGDCVEILDPEKSDGEGYLQEQSVVLDTKSHKLYVKVCNATANEKQARLDLSRFKVKGMAEVTTLKGNPDDENNFDNQPIKPNKSRIKAKSKMDVTIPPYSFYMMEFSL